MNDTVCLVESQVDWLTCSADRGPKADELREHGERLAAAAVADGARTKPFSFFGYVGVKAGRVRLGVSDRGTLLQLSGDLADQHLASTLPLSDRVTRLDLAVTFKTREKRTDLATIAAVDFIQWWKAHGERPDWTLIASGRGGETLYVGDRTSQRFFRLYDKAQESSDPHYARCWRAELECKGDTGSSFAHRLAPDPFRPSNVRAAVYDHMAEHGIRPQFERAGDDMLWHGFRRRSDTDQTLLWLSTRVSSTVNRLIDLGHEDEVRAALGLVVPPEVDPAALPPLAHAPSARRTP